MKPVTEPILCAAASAFDFGGPMVCDPHHYGEGHINDTFVVWRADHTKRFILQRINTDTFTDPAGLMENICGVTRHLRAKIQAEGGDPGRECLNVIPTLSGASYYIDTEGMTGNVIHNGINYNRRNEGQLKSILPKSSKISDFLVPSENCFNNGFGWNETFLFPCVYKNKKEMWEKANSYIGSQMRLEMPLLIGDKEVTYTFYFELKELLQKKKKK